jgi:flagellar basal-body rod protein FlgC
MRLDTNVSALNAFGVSAQVTANNVANVNTADFQASRTRLESGPGDQGVRVASIQKDTTPGAPLPVAMAAKPGQRASNTDLSREMVGLGATQRGYQANASALRTQSELVGYLFDRMV